MSHLAHNAAHSALVRLCFVFLAFTGGFCITTPTQMIGLAFYVTATAQPHATSVAVYTALFSFKGHPPEPERSLLFLCVKYAENSVNTLHSNILGIFNQNLVQKQI